MAKMSEETIDGVTVFHLAGSLTQDGVPEIEQRIGELTKIKGSRIVIDVGKVDAITTPAITLFLATVRALGAIGGKLVFANVQGITGDIFTRCRLDVIFAMSGDVATAVKLAKE